MLESAIVDEHHAKAVNSALTLVGVVSLTPPHTYTNEEIAHALNLPALPRVCRRIGIHSRRAFLQLDLENGRVVGEHPDCELEIAEEVANLAIRESGISRESISVLCLISCTVQQGRRMHFQLSSHELIRRLGIKTTVHRFEMDSGCDGFIRALHIVRNLFKVKNGDHVLIVTTSLPSLYFNRERTQRLPNEAQFSNYVFGDGAAAAILGVGGATGGGVIQATCADCDPAIELAWTGLCAAGNARELPEVSYNIDFAAVDKSYVPFIARAVRNLFSRYPNIDLEQLIRFYFHQANGVLPLRAAHELGVPPGKLAMNAGDSGNTGAASIPVMLAEDYRKGIVRKGDQILLAAVGAGLDYSAAFIQY
jgi:3-oxoacyl-[acyl-carrier-protein] synthase-3